MKSLIDSLCNNKMLSLIMRLANVMEFYLFNFNCFLNNYCIVFIIQGFVKTSITRYDVVGRWCCYIFMKV